MDCGGYVVKLGGSLIDVLDDLIPVLQKSMKNILIVPGGGSGAEAIRRQNPPPDTAHWMAILAMEHFGHQIASTGLSPVSRLFLVKKPSVLLPYCLLRKEDPFPHSWDITSDSIAAWVAWSLDLPLIVLKSVDGIISGGRVLDSIHHFVPTDTVDPAFLPFILEKKVPAIVINGRRNDSVNKALLGDWSIGTRIMGRTEEL
ncbi:uridylate kinase [Methanocalculus sp. MSAO_Arc2]|uniref:uridylate kinase n=1 Tax=Methanocalculus sp. MSAO_Arc2 TaxID=2293855 RepID=UPI00269876B3